VLLVSVLVPAVTQPAAAAATATLTVSPTRTVAGSQVSGAGRISTEIRRPVRLQHLEAGTWHTTATSRTTKRGSYQLTDPDTRLGSYRVLAPRKVIRGHLYRRVISPVRVVHPATGLVAGQQLSAGQYLESPNGTYRLTMQPDGNVVLRKGGTALWSTGTSGSSPRLAMQPDGNLVVYRSTGAAWSTVTAGFTGARLDVQDDGNIVVYLGSRALWSRNTGRLYNQLKVGQTLSGNAFISSPNRVYTLVAQSDGNVVEYKNGTAPVWATSTNGSNRRLAMQSDGNLVVYRDGNVPLWSSNTAGYNGATLFLQDDGNLVIYRNSLALWDRVNGALYNQLRAGQSLANNASIQSTDRAYQLVMQTDGNLVIYKSGVAQWSTSTAGPNRYAVMQGDGNFVIYHDGNGAVWNTSTGGHPGARLVMQTDGNLVVYQGSTPLWARFGLGGGGNPDTGGYPDDDAVDCSAQFGIYSWCKNGTWASSRGFAYRNCTDFVAWKKGMVWSQIQHNNSANAIDWRQGWLDRGRTVSTTPVVGSVAWWGTSKGKLGHVAYVKAVNPDGSVVVEQYNRGGTGRYSVETTRAEYYLY
jgi:hypothetical protein